MLSAPLGKLLMVGVGFSAPFLVEGVGGSRVWAADVELAGLGLNCSGFVSRSHTAGARGSSPGTQQSSWRGAEAVAEPNQTVPMLGTNSGPATLHRQPPWPQSRADCSCIWAGSLLCKSLCLKQPSGRGSGDPAFSANRFLTAQANSCSSKGIAVPERSHLREPLPCRGGHPTVSHPPLTP